MNAVRTRLALLTALATAAFLLVAGPAQANSPWWHLTSAAVPTKLKAGVAQNEVWEVTVSATAGYFFFEDPRTGESDFFPPLPHDATHEEVQAALEGIFGAGNVEVSGGPGDAAGTSPYLIEFKGALTDRHVPLLAKSFPFSFFGFSPLSGGTHGNGEAAIEALEQATGRPDGTIVVAALNLGNAPVSGEMTISDTLPPGLVPQSVEFFAPNTIFAPNQDLVSTASGFELCQTTASSASCSITQEFIEAGKTNDAEGNPKPLRPYQQLTMRIQVKDEGAAPPALNQLSASGGATVPATLRRPIALGEGPVPFGLDDFRLTPEEEGGATATRAGSHPFQLTTDVAFNRSSTETRKVPALPRNLHFNLPPGQLGSALAAPQCSDADFAKFKPGSLFIPNFCPPDTAIGATVVTANVGLTEEETFIAPVFNLVPAPGEPARFGFEVDGNPVILDTAVRSGPGQDYGVTVTATNTTQLAAFLSATTVFWGAPAAASHDESRGWGCLEAAAGGAFDQTCEPANNPKPPAFLTLPTDCAAPFDPIFEGVSWPTQAAPEGFQAEPRESPLQDQAGNPLSLSACNQVPFDPRIEAEPTSNAATSPTGLNFEINVEDPGLTDAGGVAQSQIKKAVVTLPQGFTTNPSVAEGLHACSEAQFESETVDSPPGAGCPNESNVGKVEIESPLVAQKIIGALYVATQHDNPNHNLLTLYLVAKNPEIGILVKQAFEVTPDPVTGQLTTEVDNVPELPFSHFRLSFRQGQRSPLITPPACGPYTVAADLYPWARPDEAVHRTSSFQITQGPEGLPCPSGGVPPFHPNLHAGTYSNQAGAYSPFYTRLTRRDSEQEITHFSIKLPPGVIGKLAGVAQCSDVAIAAAKAREHEGGGSEEQNSPSCPANSEVGHSLVGSGVGNVLAYAPGKLYLAGPYHGSNISLVSITAAKVGPFDLGTVVVRFALRINPETAEVFVDATGSDPIPHIVDGIPVHLRDIQAYVDRPEFTLTPTSCAKTSTASTVLGSGLDFASAADDVPVTVSSFFQVANCAALPFRPTLKLRLRGGTRRGAFPALRAELTQRPGEASVGRARVTLPHSEFLEQGHIGTVCTRVQFKEGTVPGEKCPAASVYGKAQAITPILSEPLEGPVYLRSSEHKLPDLVAALHNAQVDIALDGRIDSVKGQIRNTFEAVPDAPVTRFTLEMQGGKKGLLVNSTNLCTGTHKAIAAFTGHNGKLHDFNPVLKPQCRKGHKGHTGHGKRSAHGHRRTAG